MLGAGYPGIKTVIRLIDVGCVFHAVLPTITTNKQRLRETGTQGGIPSIPVDTKKGIVMAVTAP